WRSHAAHARRGDPGTARSTPAYLRSRLVRIMPAYGALVVAAMLLLPQNHVNGPGKWLVNLTLTQIYTPGFLVAGLTHAWSLAVEMAFYLALPVLWTAMKGLHGDAARWRIPVIAAFGMSGVLFPMIPWQSAGLLPAGVNEQILPPAFAAWFAVGMILAEVATAPPGTFVRLCRDRLARWGWWTAGGADHPYGEPGRERGRQDLLVDPRGQQSGRLPRDHGEQHAGHPERGDHRDPPAGRVPMKPLHRRPQHGESQVKGHLHRERPRVGEAGDEESGSVDQCQGQVDEPHTRAVDVILGQQKHLGDHQSPVGGHDPHESRA